MVVIDLGDPVYLSFLVTGTNGNLAAGGSVTVTITQPDGTVAVSPAITNTSVGAYEATFVPTLVGRHAVRWVNTGTNPCSKSDTFEVSAGTPGFLMSLADARSILRFVGTDDDEDLREVLAGVTTIVEDVVGPVLVRNITEVHNLGYQGGNPNYTGWGGAYGSPAGGYGGYRPVYWAQKREIVLNERPVVALVSLQAVLSNGVSYLPTDCDLDTNTGIIRKLDGYGFFGPLRITYSAGRVTTPPNIFEGAKEVLRHVWDSRRGHSQQRLSAVMRPVLAEEFLAVTPSGYLIPQRAMEWFGPSRREPVLV